MSLTVNTIAYSNDTARTPDSYRYHGPDHTATAKDYVDLKRVTPRLVNGVYSKSRAQAKLTRTMTDGTDPLDDGICTIDIAYPVGASSAEITALLVDLATWATTAAGDALVSDHSINQ